MWQRLGKNKGAYFGDGVDIYAVLHDDLQAARLYDWQVDKIGIHEELPLYGLRKSAASPRKNLYLSTGIHGDEPAGPLAVRQLLQANDWPADVSVWICPCLNPNGFPLNRRENPHGVDLNRQYHDPQAAEVRAHVGWLERQPAFDLSLCLHEDWESHGFYVYELNPDERPSLAAAIIAGVEKVCPVDPSAFIENFPAKNGIIRPDFDPVKRPLWPEAFYLIKHKTRQSYTLEAPSDFPLEVRVNALLAGVRAVLEAI